ncbi:CUN100 hypothetical protein [Culex nigripalpus nucleopolyhedrovirus]|uniref:Uncharacterized protein n=1 Tax=Culex nigripalpus nucleopolyhedrovirus (isolate Florida/1997) TaxID=645993 RepID=Q919H7_NPVCO|nr:CUN100 hypothetical protein [Culex nigripalpus nucleopolyhedrovirus]AAK94178.1 CUN100 hypothetical protein [Culex nigripalpus nucleopolyhedrovirus]
MAQRNGNSQRSVKRFKAGNERDEYVEPLRDEDECDRSQGALELFQNIKTVKKLCSSNSAVCNLPETLSKNHLVLEADDVKKYKMLLTYVPKKDNKHDSFVMTLIRENEKLSSSPFIYVMATVQTTDKDGVRFSNMYSPGLNELSDAVRTNEVFTNTMATFGATNIPRAEEYWVKPDDHQWFMMHHQDPEDKSGGFVYSPMATPPPGVTFQNVTIVARYVGVRFKFPSKDEVKYTDVFNSVFIFVPPRSDM